MPPKFGTSGLRGLVADLSPELVQSYVHAFASACPTGAGLYVGHDLRASSPSLANSVKAAALSTGLNVTYCGAVATPALALAAMTAGAAAIMVTGSHIPADRNGLKFYTPDGEITKAQEQAILRKVGTSCDASRQGEVDMRDNIMPLYNARYAAAFAGCLTGMRVGVFMHSAVGRDHLVDLLKNLGADSVPLGRSDDFVPVDTEAISDAFRDDFKRWASMHQLDAIISTDADGDRPLLTDEDGTVIPGDILGQITARVLQADTVVTPVSSNAGVEISGAFASVKRTKIGSPFVLAEMEKADGRVVGYEANGGFILGAAADGPKGRLEPLMTRDALLPILAVLSAARSSSVMAIVAQEPPCVTAADRLQNVNVPVAQVFLRDLVENATKRSAFLAEIGMTETGLNLTDGVRMSLEHAQTIHLRLSGNAPELRVYVEAHDQTNADLLLKRSMQKVKEILNKDLSL